MAECSLYIDSDGTPGGTHVAVLGEDGSCLGELKRVEKVDFSLSTESMAEVKLTIRRVPGRFLANEVLIETIRASRWRRWFRRWWSARWRLPWIAS